MQENERPCLYLEFTESSFLCIKVANCSLLTEGIRNSKEGKGRRKMSMSYLMCNIQILEKKKKENLAGMQAE